jgi:hypothetical protein
MIPPKKPNQRHITVKGRISTSSADSAPAWRFIILTQGKFAIVDAKNYEWLNQWKWYANKAPNTFYAQRKSKDGKVILMHREILNIPKGMQTDHRNHNGLDNRECNIRLCNNAENQYNQATQLNRTSIYKGVTWHKRAKRWYSRIKQNGKEIHIGCFGNEFEATKAYDVKALELFGEFAYTNFCTGSASLAFY